ncbi:MAG: alkene reductase [Cyanobacteria bacterium SZAS LIN-2]|nr:alkene reductase [Cyanobacteria bacterium SZAS LIN-3]MBS1995320.1 alkene reductase [Cyanobacteria bacterium SZAS LIN-2]
MSFTSLLSPFNLHDLAPKNRVVMAPLTRSRAGEKRIANELMAQYYTQRASAGLIVSEATVISEQANGWLNTPGIYTDEQTEGWKVVTKAVRETGTPMFMQLWHCGRASHSSFRKDGSLPVAASPIAITSEPIHTPLGKVPHEVPRALETDELPAIVEDYRRAAERAREAGFDGIEIHSANGYLLDNFLQSKTNQRTDKYGGSVENRYRLLGQVVDAVTSVWPAHRVGVRLSPNGIYNDMGSPDFREQFTYVAQQLDKYGLAYLHVMDGLAFGFHNLGEPMTLPEFRKVFKNPLIGNCGYDAPTANAAVENGHADMVAFGRPYLSNPDLVERFTNGWPLNDEANMKLWYAFGPEGYVDFPTYQASPAKV